MPLILGKLPISSRFFIGALPPSLPLRIIPIVLGYAIDL